MRGKPRSSMAKAVFFLVMSANMIWCQLHAGISLEKNAKENATHSGVRVRYQIVMVPFGSVIIMIIHNNVRITWDMGD